MNIDCASAIVGFDYTNGWVHPSYDGFVVCEEFEEMLVAAWELVSRNFLYSDQGTKSFKMFFFRMKTSWTDKRRKKLRNGFMETGKN